MAVAVIAATIGTLIFSGVLGSTEAPTPLITSVSITPDAPARLVSPDGAVTIDLDANTVDAPSKLTYATLSPAEIPALPTNFTATSKAFDLTVETALLKPITITVVLSVADAVLAGAVEDNIVIQHHSDGAWTPLPTAVDFRASTATIQVDRLSIFVLTVRQPEPTPAPTPTGTAVPPATPTTAPTAKATQEPTATPVPAPTVTPTTLPTPTAVPTAKPSPTATSTPPVLLSTTPTRVPSIPAPAFVPEPSPTSIPAPVPTANLSPESSMRGTQLVISGEDFSSSSIVTVAYGDTMMASVVTDGKGRFTTFFDVPDSATIGGDNEVEVTDVVTGRRVLASHQVPSATLSIEPVEGAPLTFITLTGVGFPPSKPWSKITIVSSDISSQFYETDASGSL